MLHRPAQGPMIRTPVFRAFMASTRRLRKLPDLHTVDGPAKSCTIILLGFLPSQVVQDFATIHSKGDPADVYDHGFKHSSICSSHLIVDTTDVLHDIQHKAWSHSDDWDPMAVFHGCVQWIFYGEIMGRLWEDYIYYIILYYIILDYIILYIIYYIILYYIIYYILYIIYFILYYIIYI